jgi:hypothetical protein
MPVAFRATLSLILLLPGAFARAGSRAEKHTLRGVRARGVRDKRFGREPPINF